MQIFVELVYVLERTKEAVSGESTCVNPVLEFLPPLQQLVENCREANGSDGIQIQYPVNQWFQPINTWYAEDSIEFVFY